MSTSAYFWVCIGDQLIQCLEHSGIIGWQDTELGSSFATNADAGIVERTVCNKANSVNVERDGLAPVANKGVKGMAAYVHNGVF